jgi:hypothetical protein
VIRSFMFRSEGMEDLFDSMIPSSLISTDGLGLWMDEMVDDRKKSPLVASRNSQENSILCLPTINPKDDDFRWRRRSSPFILLGLQECLVQFDGHSFSSKLLMKCFIRDDSPSNCPKTPHPIRVCYCRKFLQDEICLAISDDDNPLTNMRMSTKNSWNDNFLCAKKVLIEKSK